VRFSRRFVLPAVACTAFVLLTACTTSASPDGRGSSPSSAIVLAVGNEPASLHPLAGFGYEGASMLFDGLVEHDSDRSLRPVLAAELPVPSAGGRSWTVKLRTDAKFQDGSAFDARDVVATYHALLDPAFASPLRASYGMLSGVEQLDPATVRFDLAYPYAPFPHLLALGVLARSAFAAPGPVRESPMGTKPVGTGPYQLVEWRKHDRMVLAANDNYFGGVPKVRTVTVLFGPDDTARAQRVRSGEVDSAPLPATLARQFDKVSGFKVISDRSSDYRAITMPMRKPVTGDHAVRLALNYAVNRQAMVDGALAGKGSAASTPISEGLAEFVEPAARWSRDQAAAERILDQAGWIPGPGGVRARDGVPARFTVIYPTGDVERQDLARMFASDAKAVGIDVVVEGVGADAMAARASTDALVLGGGSAFDPDFDAYPLLHSAPTPAVPSVLVAGPEFDNPGGYANAQVDAALDAGRRTTDPAQRAVAYRQFQRAYVADPGMVFLAFVDHTYVVKANWTGYQPVVDSHGEGLTWGLWWNLPTWNPR
jgi:peptide/nickel transport system substrate-binding protein